MRDLQLIKQLVNQYYVLNYTNFTRLKGESRVLTLEIDELKV